MIELAPGSALGNAGYRALLAAASLRLHGRDPGSRAVRAALRRTAAGRADDAERAWLTRIDSHRRALAEGAIAAHAEEHPGELTPEARADEAAAACLWMSLPPLLGLLLLRLVRELAPASCLELGTGFGVSTSYQAAALELNGGGSLLSLDVEGMAAIAGPGLASLGLGDRVQLRPGNIEETLAGAVSERAPIDFALLDADHTERATVEAFERIVPGLAPIAVLVLDDINWTAGMRNAWRAVQAHPRVRSSVALRRLGIVVTRPSPGAG